MSEVDVSREEYDLIVIGGGSGGMRAARRAAALGLRTALVEEKAIGGTCLNLGCIPKKLYVYAAETSHVLKTAGSYGFEVPAQAPLDWATLQDRVFAHIERVGERLRAGLQKVGVECLRGRASFVTTSQLCVHGPDGHARDIRGKSILIATGGKPRIPEKIRGWSLGDFSSDVFTWRTLPKRVCVVGSGFVGVEFASLFSLLGVDVTLVSSREDPLPETFDLDVRRRLRQVLAKRLHFVQGGVESLEKLPGDDLRVTCKNGTVHEVDRVILTVGRVANFEGLGLEKLGVDLEHFVHSSPYRTTLPNVYILGDALGRMMLTPVAIAEAECFVQGLGDETMLFPDYEGVPVAVFSTPPVATLGVSEKEARKVCGTVQVFETSFRPLSQVLLPEPQETYMKVVVDETNDSVLGIHILGEHAEEIIQGFVPAFRAGLLTKFHLDESVGIHPSSGEELFSMRDAKTT